MENPDEVVGNEPVPGSRDVDDEKDADRDPVRKDTEPLPKVHARVSVQVE